MIQISQNDFISAGATFSKDIEQTMSPIMSFLINLYSSNGYLRCSWTIPWKKA